MISTLQQNNHIAVLGGAFDPPHNVHLDIAKACMEERGYTRIIFLPSYNPPHKCLAATTDQRLDMLKLSIKDNANYEICTLEVERNKIGYTVDTLPELKMIYGEFDFVIGGDSMRDMHKWYQPERILMDTKIVVAVRDKDESAVLGAIDRYKDCPKKGIEIMRYIPQSMSSTDIRLMVQLGLDINSLVPSKVSEYIAENHVYGTYDAIRNKVKATLSSEKYVHSISTVRMAMELNNQLKLDYNKVFIAALLHDIAKNNVNHGHVVIPKDSENTPVAHAFIGAEVARKDFGIVDNDILDAIYYHTTGSADMTALEKLIYVSDMVEINRKGRVFANLRAICRQDFEKGFVACIKSSYEFLLSKDVNIYYLTEEAYNYYCK